MAIQNALTIDVEDYYQVTNFEVQINRDNWHQYESRVVESTRRILRLLERYGVHATFFVLGYVADRHPDLVREIDAGGHEIGSHSYWHRLVFRLMQREFREDVRRSKAVLEDLIGKPVTAFRAPSFSILKHSMWALDILADEGFTVDSSIFPMFHDVDAVPNGMREPYAHELDTAKLWEFPMAVYRLANRIQIPISGGGYFRLLPFRLTKRLLRHRNQNLSVPFVFYIHPWEFDPRQPRLKAGTRSQRWRHYLNLRTTEAKFERLLQSFSFDRMDRVLEAYVNPHVQSGAARSASTLSFAPIVASRT